MWWIPFARNNSKLLNSGINQNLLFWLIESFIVSIRHYQKGWKRHLMLGYATDAVGEIYLNNEKVYYCVGWGATEEAGVPPVIACGVGA